MILGIGIDILSLSRFRALILRRDPDKLAKRICTPREYDLFKGLALTSKVGASASEKEETFAVGSEDSTLSGRPAGASILVKSDSIVGGVSVHVQEHESGQDTSEELVEKQLRFLSCRWALKEAAYKSLPHIPQLNWQHLEITHLPSGAPTLLPTNPAHRDQFHLMGSLSHDAGVVVGVVVAQVKAGARG